MPPLALRTAAPVSAGGGGGFGEERRVCWGRRGRGPEGDQHTSAYTHTHTQFLSSSPTVLQHSEKGFPAHYWFLLFT